MGVNGYSLREQHNKSIHLGTCISNRITKTYNTITIKYHNVEQLSNIAILNTLMESFTTSYVTSKILGKLGTNLI